MIATAYTPAIAPAMATQTKRVNEKDKDEFTKAERQRLTVFEKAVETIKGESQDGSWPSDKYVTLFAGRIKGKAASIVLGVFQGGLGLVVQIHGTTIAQSWMSVPFIIQARSGDYLAGISAEQATPSGYLQWNREVFRQIRPRPSRTY